MKIVVACDSFKGSLSSAEVGEACAVGIRYVVPDADIRVVQVGDGGEGTADALVDGLDGRFVTCSVHDPLGLPVEARYGISGNGTTAIMEMAQASGLPLIHPAKRNPMLTSTYGTGEMIADALRRGCTTILTGIGGSATNDGGMGMLAALGVRFLDSGGRELKPCGAALEHIAAIDSSTLMPQAREARFIVACDVDNPLYGPSGAAHVFAPQKGATPRMVELLDQGLRNYARAVIEATGKDVAGMAGAGAAGGLGAAFAAFLDAKLTPGINMMLDAVRFDDIVRDADLVITGEGRLDSQTVMGKAPAGVLKVARRHNVPVVAIGGSITDADTLIAAGFIAVLPVVDGPVRLENAMNPDVTRRNISRTVIQIMRLLCCSRPISIDAMEKIFAQ